jgi:hypothetical protein
LSCRQPRHGAKGKPKAAAAASSAPQAFVSWKEAKSLLELLRRREAEVVEWTKVMVRKQHAQLHR